MLDFRDHIAVTTLGDLLLRAAAERPEHPALVFPEARRSFAEMAEGAIRQARALRALGVGPGDHVGVLLPSSIAYVEAVFGIALLGAVAVPVNARYRATELGYVLRDADLKVVLATGEVAAEVDFVARLTEAFPALAEAASDARLALPDAPALDWLVTLGDGPAPGFLSRDRYLAGAEAVPEAEIDALRRRVRVRDTVLILYTSGTTSAPKGCLIPHEALLRTGQGIAKRYEMGPEDVFWSPLPMFHIGALFPLTATWSVAATYLAMARFDAGTGLRMMAAERATLAYPSFGTFISDMIHHPEFETTDLSALRLMNGNMAMQPASFRETLREKLPNCVQVGTFGMTETSGTVTTSFPTDDYATRTERLGRPLEGLEVRILREDGSEAATDEIGEIAVRGFSVFTEYYKDPEKTAAAIRDGWFHTGDLGALDAGGSLMFHGRLKDMLKVGGENVAALEIEALLGQHPDVSVAQVVGKPDPRLQEVPVAFVETRPGAEATAEALIDFCRGKVASFKVPREVHFVTEWPMSASKIQKFRLRERLGA
jgi:acyl-CoA synthetase (AMP-forming)/AMP-acid ligase II